MTIFYTILYYLHVVQFYYFGLLNKKMVATQAPPSFYFFFARARPEFYLFVCVFSIRLAALRPPQAQQLLLQ